MERAEEIVALQSIYCGANEFVILQKGDESSSTIIEINITVTTNDESILVKLLCTLSPDYPRQGAAFMKENLMKHTTELCGSQMIMEMITWVQENTYKYIANQCDLVTNIQPAEDQWMTLLHLDHMRAKTKYIKIIQRWTEEFRLTGRLIFQGNLIFLLLQGSKNALKEYIMNHRTVNVDVDSKGRSCKERMLRVLDEQQISSSLQLENFSVVEVSSRASLEELFGSWSLNGLFDSHILKFYKV